MATNNYWVSCDSGGVEDLVCQRLHGMDSGAAQSSMGEALCQRIGVNEMPGR